MKIAETLFLFLTFCLGMISICSFTLKLMKLGFILMIITFILGMITLYISCKNINK